MKLSSYLQKRIEHLDLIEGIVVNVLQTKWKSFIRRVFFKQMMIYFVYFVISICVFVTRPVHPMYTCVAKEDISESLFDGNGTDTDITTTMSSLIDIELATVANWPPNVTMGTNITDSLGNGDEGEEEEEFECGEDEVVQFRDECHMNDYDTSYKQGRLLGEILCVLYSIYYLALGGREWSFLGWRIFLQNLSLCPSRVFFLLGCILLIMCVPFRIACLSDAEDALVSVVMIAISGYALFFCR